MYINNTRYKPDRKSAWLLNKINGAGTTDYKSTAKNVEINYNRPIYDGKRKRYVQHTMSSAALKDGMSIPQEILKFQDKGGGKNNSVPHDKLGQQRKPCVTQYHLGQKEEAAYSLFQDHCDNDDRSDIYDNVYSTILYSNLIFSCRSGNILIYPSSFWNLYALNSTSRCHCAPRCCKQMHGTGWQKWSCQTRRVNKC